MVTFLGMEQNSVYMVKTIVDETDTTTIQYNPDTDIHTIRSDEGTVDVWLSTQSIVEFPEQLRKISDYTRFKETLSAFLTDSERSDSIDAVEITNIEKIWSEDELTLCMTFTLSNDDLITLHFTITPIIHNTKKQTGFGTKDCPECGTTCEITCDYGYSEHIYCEECKQKYKREVVIKENREYDITERYYCESCEDIHPAVLEREEWEKVEYSFSGYEEWSLQCRCGEYISGYDIKPNQPVKCECGRTVELSIST